MCPSSLCGPCCLVNRLMMLNYTAFTSGAHRSLHQHDVVAYVSVSVYTRESPVVQTASVGLNVKRCSTDNRAPKQ